MTNSLALSKKIKVEPGTKVHENGNRSQAAKKGFRRPTLHQEKFEGKTPYLNSFIYDTGHILQADMYVQTMKEITQCASRACKQAKYIKRTIKKLKETMTPKPMMVATMNEEIKDVEGKIDLTIANIYLMKEIDMYLKRKEVYHENKTKMFNMIIGQCTELMMSKLEIKTK
eukprot:2200952-Ditylum_brightwellii.AAC.1